ncbi:MAG: recombinase family protein [Devosia sp.]
MRSKAHLSKCGKRLGGHRFSRGALYRILRNPTYRGRIVHRGVTHEGLHPAIIDADLFAAVQASIDVNARRHGARTDHMARAPLKSHIFDADGQPMSPTIAYGKGGKVYRYYVSAPLQQGQRLRACDGAIHRVAADPLKALLRDTMMRLAPSFSGEPLDPIVRVEAHAMSLQILMPLQLLRGVLGRVAVGEHAEPDPVEPSRLRLTMPVRVRFHGGRTMITSGTAPATKPDPTLVKALRAAHAMVGRDADDLPVLSVAPETPWRRRLIRLAFLAPELQRTILTGRQPQHLTLAHVLTDPLPLLWSQQMQQLGPALDN